MVAAVSSTPKGTRPTSRMPGVGWHFCTTTPGSRCVAGSITVIANSFQGRRLNRPNDVIVKSDGCIYFTDPNAAIVPEQWDLQYAGVYRITPDLGTLTLLTDSFVNPNGLAFSPDEKFLYINDSRRAHIRIFELSPNGLLAKQTDRVFADLSGS